MGLSRRKAKGTPQADGGGGDQRSSCAQAQRPQGPDGAGPERGLQKGPPREGEMHRTCNASDHPEFREAAESLGLN